MTASSASTKESEVGWWRTGSVVGVSHTKAGPQTVRLVDQSADTRRTPWCKANLPAALPEDVQATLDRCASWLGRTVGTSIVSIPVVWPATPSIRSFRLESPTAGLTVEPLQVRWLRGTAHNEPVLEYFTLELSALSGSIVMTAPVEGLTGTAQSLTAPPALLSSTDLAAGVSRVVEAKFTEVVALATGEWFEDGIESSFSRALSNMLHAYGDAAIAAVEKFLRSPTSNMEIAVEAARWLGEVEHPASQRYRRTLLETLLTAAAARLRHAAAAGLASMDDPSSLSVVCEARDRETNRRLRRFLELVAEQLQHTNACAAS